MSKKNICLYGAASSNIDDRFLQEGERLGKEIGRRGHALIYGGGATGMMGACAEGVYSAGGDLTGVAPSFMSEYELLNTDKGRLIFTKTMDERKKIMEDMADAFIICPGGIGTMDEFFQILALVSLNRKIAPIILYNIDGYYDDLISFIDQAIKKGFIRAGVKNLFQVSSSPEDALNSIEYFS